MKLNLGCGRVRKDGWLNVDRMPAPGVVDLVYDLDQLPWPWETNSVDEIQMVHVLEHLGQTRDVYLGIWKELYRICKPNADIRIVVPHPRHDDYMNDPTHVRPITAEALLLFSVEENKKQLASGRSNTPLAIHLAVDFKMVSANGQLDHHWAEEFRIGKITQEEMNDIVRQHNNVVKQTEVILKVVKDG